MPSLLTRMLPVITFAAVIDIHAAPPDNAAEVVKHLEFQGYEVAVTPERITAKHDENLNLLIKKFGGGMLATTFFESNEAGKREKGALLDIINRLNQEAAAARYYIDAEGDVIVEAYYPGEYNKKSFSAFLRAFNAENETLGSMSDELARYLQ